MQGASAHDAGDVPDGKVGEQQGTGSNTGQHLEKITGTLSAGNNGAPMSIYVKDIYYDGTDKESKAPHKTCEITVGDPASPSSTGAKIDAIDHFYMADFRKDGTNKELRGVRYKRTTGNEFEAWSDRDDAPIWGMSTDRTHIVIRLKNSDAFKNDDQLQIVCKNGSDVIVSYAMTIKYLNYDHPPGLTWNMKRYVPIYGAGPFPGIPEGEQGYVLNRELSLPGGVSYQRLGAPSQTARQLFNFAGTRPKYVESRLSFLKIKDENTDFFHRDSNRSPLQFATESMGSDASNAAASHLVTNTSFSYDSEQMSDYLVGSTIEGPGGTTINDHPKTFHDAYFYHRLAINVWPKLDPIVDHEIIASSQNPGLANEDLTVFMVKGKVYLIQVRSSRGNLPRAEQRFHLTIERSASTSSGIGSAARQGSATVASANTVTSSVPVPIPTEAGYVELADPSLVPDRCVAKDNRPSSYTYKQNIDTTKCLPGTAIDRPVLDRYGLPYDFKHNRDNTIDVIFFPEDSNTLSFHANHYRGENMWTRYSPSETGTYRVHLRLVYKNDPRYHNQDLFVWGISSLSAANCPAHASDYIDIGIPPEKFVFDQRLENRSFYAREVFPANGEGIVLRPPLEARPKYIFTVRKEIPNTERLAADIKFTFDGARFHRSMRSDGQVQIKDYDGRIVQDVSFAQVSGGNVGDKEVTFRIDNEGKGKLETGSRIEIIFPALEGVSLSRERDRVTVTPSMTIVRGAFPEGGIANCLSEVAGRGCVYARSLRTGKVDLGPVDSSGRQIETVAIIDPNDYTRLIDSQGDAVYPLDLPSSLGLGGRTGRVNAIRVGTVGLEAGMVSSAVSNSCLSDYRVESGIRPVDQFGDPLLLEYGDVINIGLSPEPSAEEGIFLMRKLGEDGRTPVGSYQQIPAGGVFSTDISRPGQRKGNWEFFFVPSGNSQMEYGDAWTLNAGVDFLYPAYRDILSEPISRSVILDHEGDLGRPQARAYSIPPLNSPDGAFVRIRCEVSGEECQISMECSNQSGQSWYGNLREYIPGGGTVVITPPEIAQALARTGFDPDIHWGGESNGRLSCAFYARPDNSISMQMFVRSAGTLTNNTDVYHSE
ncbi:MAG: hypothetical protein ISN28_02790 [Ectothiorhodospiraceae bacterium AqS1]|nr:hypothetical protein [Ectothiorhodospiraceae bacterium AqS1]